MIKKQFNLQCWNVCFALRHDKWIYSWTVNVDTQEHKQLNACQDELSSKVGNTNPRIIIEILFLLFYIEKCVPLK